MGLLHVYMHEEKHKQNECSMHHAKNQQNGTRTLYRSLSLVSGHV